MPHDNLKKFEKAYKDIINHPKWDEMLGELDTELPEHRHEIKADAKKHLKDKGIPVHDEMNVKFTEGSFSIRVCGWGYCITLAKE